MKGESGQNNNLSKLSISSISLCSLCPSRRGSGQGVVRNYEGYSAKNYDCLCELKRVKRLVISMFPLCLLW